MSRPRRFASAVSGGIAHVLRADMRRSPFYFGVATLIMAWLLGTLALALLAPLLEARHLTRPSWLPWGVFAASLVIVFLLRRKKWGRHLP